MIQICEFLLDPSYSVVSLLDMRPSDYAVNTPHLYEHVRDTSRDVRLSLARIRSKLYYQLAIRV